MGSNPKDTLSPALIDLIRATPAAVLNQADRHGDGLVHFAARAYALPLLTALHDHGANMMLVNEHGRQPLHEALGDLACTQYLLATCHVNANAMKRGDWTPVMIATNKDDLATVQLLVRHGALLDLKTKDRRTALHMAVQQGNVELVQFLIKACPANLLAETKSGRIPVQMAAALTDNLAATGHRLTQDFLATHRHEQLSHRDQAGCTVLVDAIVANQLATVAWLATTAGADLSTRDALGRQGWHHAAMLGHVAMLRLWHQLTLQDLVGLNQPDTWDHWTPLMHAARHNHLDAVQCLLELGADTSLLDKLGRSAKDIALLWQHHAVAQLLSMQDK
ncbi:ankyrin [Hesseltinella vesiculosa]|uniref:Ankyrin n=1 Tax=Hesseltinella vesiculosa TaxID=101127 RepID=A0A1X2GN76_9FUNG|nr:ankyrin [Hesseltinella vesiculosa]